MSCVQCRKTIFRKLDLNSLLLRHIISMLQILPRKVCHTTQFGVQMKKVKAKTYLNDRFLLKKPC